MPAEGPLRDRTPAGFELIETLGWLPGGTMPRFEMHVRRMERSAHEFLFPFSRDGFTASVSTVRGGDAPLRLRITLGADGIFHAAAQPFVPLPPDTVWRVAVAATRMDPDDPMNLHKTTLRGRYEQARAEYPTTEIDEIILLNERGEVCEGTITNVFVDADGSGRLLTPMLASGPLPGCLRRELLLSGRAVPASLTVADLRAASRLYVGNSLRGLIPALLA